MPLFWNISIGQRNWLLLFLLIFFLVKSPLILLTYCLISCLNDYDETTRGGWTFDDFFDFYANQHGLDNDKTSDILSKNLNHNIKKDNISDAMVDEIIINDMNEEYDIDKEEDQEFLSEFIEIDEIHKSILEEWYYITYLSVPPKDWEQIHFHMVDEKQRLKNLDINIEIDEDLKDIYDLSKIVTILKYNKATGKNINYINNEKLQIDIDELL